MRRWRSNRRLLVVAALAFAATAVARAEQPVALQSSFSAEGLQRASAYMQNEVAVGYIPGAIVLIQQHGTPAFTQKFGARDVIARAPMTDDAIFRFYSMSQPVTSVAVMMLVADGKIALGD